MALTKLLTIQLFGTLLYTQIRIEISNFISGRPAVILILIYICQVISQSQYNLYAAHLLIFNAEPIILIIQEDTIYQFK